MIQIGDYSFALDDPRVIGAMVGFAVLILLFVLLIMAVRATGRSARMMAPLGQQMGYLGQRVEALSDGQSQLAGGLQTVSQTQAVAQAELMKTLEQRLAEVQSKMTDTLHGTSVRTTRSLTELQERLATIDKAQTNIEKLSGDVLSLQDILSNKQTRGAFGEIQLNDIVSKALPADSK